ncbi:O-antigen/teichoic acid export membrane protein [Balneicella halophila]|uniref:O-antigen/teichoic acid export membrane protein n=1 Tax=Balneicella halophila TaxID=1537566 RepID=A0A7L4UPR4_BALHA|nr:polysaccharide biosynthesis C-terminal domain-containing protein [Balneicella halophila]PVX50796.1 O-antigen/teichoic acid export membrane protein [Balneicella halophila]
MNKATKETLLSTVFSYLGIFLATFYTIFIIPKLFHDHPENWGALQFVLNYAGLFLILASLATPQSIIKFYPLYPKPMREQLLSFLFWMNTLGIAISFICFYIYTKERPVEVFIDGKLTDIKWFFYPLLVSMTLFAFFESYCHALLKIAMPAFLNNTFTRFWFFFTILLYYYNVISFNTFTYLYFGQFIFSFVFLVLFVWKIKKDQFRFIFKIPENYQEILRYSLYALPATSAAVLITKIDIQMIGSFLGKAEVAYYTYAIFFMSFLLIPKNTLMQTSRSIISRDFQTLSIGEFTPKYHKISVAFAISTLILFVGITINIEELMLILGDKFGSSSVKYSVLILGTGRVLESLFISNHAVLEYSKFYKKILLFEMTALLLLIFLNYLLIPTYGIIGAAITSAIILFLNAVAKSIFVYKKLNISPIRKKDIKIVLSIALLVGLYFIPIPNILPSNNDIINYILTILLRSIAYAILLWLVVKYFGIHKLYMSETLTNNSASSFVDKP